MAQATSPGSPDDSPEAGALGRQIDRFDEVVDGWFKPLRSNAVADRVMYGASTAGDWSAIWHLCGVASSVARGQPRDAVRLSVIIGLESLLVNQGIKRLFKRVRPRRDEIANERHIRQPITSSFPSGHASAAMTAAAVLSRHGKRPLWYGLALVVASSRIHVRMHHPSDVAAGLATGVILGRIANWATDRLDN
ncbi:MAG: phosphatase PAP2 family protein [Actinobacteria bacterium]|nr:phosphatase PAP2 family protein [Actinomycetota bacterium]